jgi:hypothetical protein
MRQEPCGVEFDRTVGWHLLDKLKLADGFPELQGRPGLGAVWLASSMGSVDHVDTFPLT